MAKFVEDLNIEDSWKEMEGDSNEEKRINHFLTKQFIFSRDIPADECLSEAQAILKMKEPNLEQQICRYLVQQFTYPKTDFDKQIPSAKEIMRIINELL